MAVNPVIQQKAQKEIDRVVGRNRLPDFSDRPTMPYIEAIYREVLRCRPPLQVGAPHCLIEDDHYKEYFIPKGQGLVPISPVICLEVFLHPTLIGTVVLANIWHALLLVSFVSTVLTETSRAMTHNESQYSEPFEFKPERFFDKNGELNDDDKILAFGFGRRYFPSFDIVNSFSQRYRICVGQHIANATVGTHQIF
jgi:hypothetical protein